MAFVTARRSRLLLGLAVACAALGACRGGSHANETMESAFVAQPFTLLALAGGTAAEFSAAVAPLDAAGIRHLDQWAPGKIEVFVPTADWARAREILMRSGTCGPHLRLADEPDTVRTMSKP